MTGWVSIYREIQGHWIWQDDRHLKWWLTILLNVSHTESRFPVGTVIHECNPGQSFRSIEQWTAMFSCSKKTTVKFFELLEKEGMIKREILGKGNRRKHLLTVQNWDKYQNKETQKRTETVPKKKLKEYPNRPPNNNDNNGNNVTCQEIVDLWNELLCPPLPRVIKVSDSRKNKIKSRVNEMGGQEEVNSIKKLFLKIKSAPFLLGDNDKRWHATFDWVFENDKNWVKIMEGNYGSKNISTVNGSPQPELLQKAER